MKTFLLSLTLLVLVTSCSGKAKQAVYDSMHEYERQQCLEQGRDDCQRAESYEKYKKKRDEIV